MLQFKSSVSRIAGEICTELAREDLKVLMMNTAAVQKLRPLDCMSIFVYKHPKLFIVNDVGFSTLKCRTLQRILLFIITFNEADRKRSHSHMSNKKQLPSPIKKMLISTQTHQCSSMTEEESHNESIEISFGLSYFCIVIIYIRSEFHVLL
jgi:hypothetical protein